MSNENDDMIRVRYVRNADDTHGTAAIKFNDDDRPDLAIGRVGYVTELELALASSRGVILQPITDEEIEELNLEPPAEIESESEKPKSLRELSAKELDTIASQEGIDLTGKRSNDSKADAIEKSRAERNAGESSLPATAVTTTTEPAVQ